MVSIKQVRTWENLNIPLLKVKPQFEVCRFWFLQKALHATVFGSYRRLYMPPFLVPTEGFTCHRFWFLQKATCHRYRCSSALIALFNPLKFLVSDHNFGLWPEPLLDPTPDFLSHKMRPLLLPPPFFLVMAPFSNEVNTGDIPATYIYIYIFIYMYIYMCMDSNPTQLQYTQAIPRNLCVSGCI